MLKIEDSGPLIIFRYLVPAYNPRAIGYDKFNYNSNLTFYELVREVSAFSIEYGNLGVCDYNIVVESPQGIHFDDELILALRLDNYVFKELANNLEKSTIIPLNQWKNTKVLRAVFTLIKPMKYQYHKKTKHKTTNKRKRTHIPRGLRHEVFKHDNYTCVECGARKDDGATLHVNHKIPVSKGGSDELDNLQTLCKECNLNKSDLYQKTKK